MPAGLMIVLSVTTLSIVGMSWLKLSMGKHEEAEA
jgi:hypothetical protein